MSAVDTNLLVYVHREDSPWHEAAYARIAELAEGQAEWAIPWPCVHEFLATVTPPRMYSPPTPLGKAIDQVEAWLESPRLVLLSESADYWLQLQSVLETGGCRDHRSTAQDVALCQQHGIRELWTADRDFGRFPGLKTYNPLVA
jgi:predicted nucleic acid-binding protein